MSFKWLLAYSQDLPVLKWVLKEKPELINKLDSEGDATFHLVPQEGLSLEFAQLLLANGADTSIRNNLGKTPLDIARDELGLTQDETKRKQLTDLIQLLTQHNATKLRADGAKDR